MDPNATTVRMPTLSNERAAALANAASSSTSKTKTAPPTTATPNMGEGRPPYFHTTARYAQNETGKERLARWWSSPVKSRHRSVSEVRDGKAARWCPFPFQSEVPLSKSPIVAAKERRGGAFG
jgi:hypothetical protein